MKATANKAIVSGEILSPEPGSPPLFARLLLVLARPRLNSVELHNARTLAAQEELDWGAFLDSVAQHKVLPLIGRHVDRYRLDRKAEAVQGFPYPWVFTTSYLGNRVRNQALSDEFGRLFQDLVGAGVRHAVRKGFYLAEYVYHDIGARRMGDLDLLIDRPDMPQAQRVLERLGYAQGRLAADGERVETFSEKIPSDELAYLKPGNRPDVPVFHVDVCHGIQPKAATTVPASELFERCQAVTVCGTNTWALSSADLLLDLCSLVYAETTKFHSIEDRFSIQISKFLDIAFTVERFDESNWRSFVELVHQHDAARTAFYALHFTAILYPDVIPPDNLKAVKPQETDYLEEYRSQDGQTARWAIAFPQRLFI